KAEESCASRSRHQPTQAVARLESWAQPEPGLQVDFQLGAVCHSENLAVRTHRVRKPLGPGAGWLECPLSHPQQPSTMSVDLVNHGQEIVGPLTLAPMKLVHADGANVFQLAVRQAPLDKPFHRAKDAFPTGSEGPRRLHPQNSQT